VLFRSVLFINNTCVANSWQDTRRNDPCEIAVRGNKNVVRNNIGIAVLERGTGMIVLSAKPGGRIAIDFNSITMDHNLWWNPTGDQVTFLAGEQSEKLTMKGLAEKFPHWSQATLNTDPGFVDLKNLDFRLRPGSAALKAGIADERVSTDITGKPRAGRGMISIGCYEGASEGKSSGSPEPEIVISEGEDSEAINKLLTNEYSLEWHGMLWGWGQQLYEDMPLIVDVEGPRNADFLDISGSFVLKELLDKIAKEHNVRLLLRQPTGCRGVGIGPEVISERLKIRKEAGADEREQVRSLLRTAVWTKDTEKPGKLTDKWMALQAALGLKIDSDKPIPSDARFRMNTQNLKLDAFLYDLAERMNLQFSLSVFDAMKTVAAVSVEANTLFGGIDGVVEMTIGKPDQSRDPGEIRILSRIGEKEAICARITTSESSVMIVDKDRPDDRGRSFINGAARQENGKTVRLAIIGKGCALNISNGWVLLSTVPEGFGSGNFMVRLKDAAQIRNLRYASGL
jgi:hypothetical protein